MTMNPKEKIVDNACAIRAETTSICKMSTGEFSTEMNCERN